MASNACWQVKEDKDSTLTLAFNKVALTGYLDKGCFEAAMELTLRVSPRLNRRSIKVQLFGV